MLIIEIIAFLSALIVTVGTGAIIWSERDTNVKDAFSSETWLAYTTLLTLFFGSLLGVVGPVIKWIA